MIEPYGPRNAFLIGVSIRNVPFRRSLLSSALALSQTMVKAIVNGTVIADSNDTIVVEGNHYFPPSDVKTGLFSDSNTR